MDPADRVKELESRFLLRSGETMTLRQKYSDHVFFGSAALWCMCNGIMHVIVPLYAISLGYSILEISSIVAVPVLATLVVRFVGGALSDRFGERGVLQGCYSLMTLAALMLIGAEGYASLMIVLVVANVSRSTFWIPAQSLATQLPGANVGKKLGKLAATNYSGTLLGQVLGGVMAAFLGYGLSFLILSGLALSCTLLSLALSQPGAKPKGRTVWQITLGVGNFLRYSRTWLIISASGAAALPLAMCISIYPVYLAHLNFGEQWIGVAVSLRSLGPIATGLLLGAWITPARQRLFYGLGMVVLGVSLIASGYLERYLFLSLCIILLGAGGGVMDLLYQVQASALSQASDRSMAMATTGMGWNLSPFFMPLIVGWLVEMRGFEIAFLVSGLFLMLIGAGTHFWFRLCALDEGAFTKLASK
ncbi:MAG: MFS transporter [Deltaproteobacteria bacterium]|nr:MFS transporter [Deltaproteobacteria bacterium]